MSRFPLLPPAPLRRLQGRGPRGARPGTTTARALPISGRRTASSSDQHRQSEGERQAGNDRIFTGSGNDVVWAGSGRDTVDGGDGADELNGGSGTDVLLGGFGNDRSGAARTPTSCVGGDGSDLLVGAPATTSSTATTTAARLRAPTPSTAATAATSSAAVPAAGRDDRGAGADTFHYTAQVPAFNQRPERPRHRDGLQPGPGRHVRLPRTRRQHAGERHQSFVFVDGPSTRAGDLWVTARARNWTIYLNLDGGNSDMAIDVHLAGGATNLGAADFLL